MRVLMTTPDFQMLGGVSNYVWNLRGRFTQDVDYFVVGRRAGERGIWQRLRRFFIDYIQFREYIKDNPVDLLHVNPSLDWKGMIRDGLIVRAAAQRGIPVAVFFHAWSWRVSGTVDRYWQWLFRALFGGASGFMVLDAQVAETLRKWRLNQRIVHEVSVTPDERMKSFDIDGSTARRREINPWRVLFIARVVKEKGVYEALQSHALLVAKHPNVEMVIAGDGEELEHAKAFAAQMAIPNVHFAGRVTGDAKWRLYENSHALFLPSYREGCPIAIVEAMSCGLPIVTRAVGGIPGIIKDGVNGYITSSLAPSDLAALLERLYLNRSLAEEMGRANFQYAQERFTASQAARRLEDFYAECVTRAIGAAPTVVSLRGEEEH